MTHEVCFNLCVEQRYAGVHDGVECFCCDVLIVDRHDDCNVPCRGNSSQTCGGPDGIDIFELVSVVVSTPSHNDERGESQRINK